MTQLDDLQTYTNFELPRRSVLLTNAITSYDGNPNLSGAPAILQAAPLGAWFYEETSNIWWRKTGSGSTAWQDQKRLHLEFETAHTIYVDPSGNDGYPGTQALPIKTLTEAANRLPFYSTGSITVQLSAGTFQLDDHYGLSPFGTQTIFRNLTDTNDFVADYPNAIFQGTLQTDATFQVATVDDTTVTVSPSPGWTPGEHKGKLISGNFGGGYKWSVYNNTADSVTIAMTSPGNGGWAPIPLVGETLTIEGFATKIIPPSTNPGNEANALVFEGDWYVAWLSFDGQNRSTSSVPIKFKKTNNVFFVESYLEDYNGSVDFWGPGDVQTWGVYCYNFQNSAFTIWDGSLQSTDLIVHDCTQAVNVRGGRFQSWGTLFCNSTWLHYGAGNFTHLTRASQSKFTDSTNSIWIEGGGRFTPNRYIQLGDKGLYENTYYPLQFNTHSPLTEFASYVISIQADDSPVDISFLDYAGGDAISGASGFANIDGEVISMNSWVNGTSPCSSPYFYEDNRGNRIYDRQLDSGARTLFAQRDFIETSSGVDDAYKPVILSADGRLDVSMINANVLDSVRRVTQVQSDTTIYVETTGNDAYDGLTPATAIATLDEAFSRIPLFGDGNDSGPCFIKMGVGTWQLTDYYGSRGTVATSANLGEGLHIVTHHGVYIQGTEVVDGTFTVSGGTLNTITVTPDPGWSADQWKGYLANWDIYQPDYFQGQWIIGNTSDTLTVAITPASQGGFESVPTSGTIRIEHLGTIIQSAPTNPDSNNIQLDAGRIILERIQFSWPVSSFGIALFSRETANLGAWFCKFVNPYFGIYAYGQADLYSNWYEACGDAGVGVERGSVSSVGDSVTNSSYSMYNIRGGGFFSTNNYYTTWVLAPGNGGVFWMNDGSVHDNTARVWVNTSLGRYVSFREYRNYYKSWNGIVCWSGRDNITKMFEAYSQGGGAATFDVIGIDDYSVGSAILIDDGQNTLSIADFIAGNPPANAVEGTISAPKLYHNILQDIKIFESVT